MNWTIATLLVIAALAFAALFLPKKHGTTSISTKKPLTNPEQILYFKLTKALPDHIVLAQVSYSRFIKTQGGSKKENWKKFASLKQRVADYLVCTKDFSIIAVIELDDSTHQSDKDNARDNDLKMANLRTLRWNVKNLPSEIEIKEAIKQMGVPQ